MQSPQELSREIREAFESLRESNSIVPKGWVVQTVIAAHPDIAGGDSDFAALCVQGWVSHLTIKLFNEMKAATDEHEQYRLPGHDRVQSFYIVKRHGDLVAVRIHEMTDAEIESKEAEHLAMAAGHQAHANELRRYLENRRRLSVA